VHIGPPALAEIAAAASSEGTDRLAEWAKSASDEPVGIAARAIYEFFVGKGNIATAKRHIDRIQFSASDLRVLFLMSTAVYQFDAPWGGGWTRWNERMKQTLLAEQETAAAGCANGSAKSAPAETAWRAITLETYYRYPPVISVRGGPSTQGIPKWTDREAEFNASRDASRLAKAEKPSDLEDSGGARKTIGSKTFYYVCGSWVDSSFDPKKGSTDGKEIARIKFMSDEYSRLISGDPELARFFSAGTDVVVVHKGRCYWVFE